MSRKSASNKPDIHILKLTNSEVNYMFKCFGYVCDNLTQAVEYYQSHGNKREAGYQESALNEVTDFMEHLADPDTALNNGGGQ